MDMTAEEQLYAAMALMKSQGEQIQKLIDEAAMQKRQVAAQVTAITGVVETMRGTALNVDKAGKNAGEAIAGAITRAVKPAFDDAVASHSQSITSGVAEHVKPTLGKYTGELKAASESMTEKVDELRSVANWLSWKLIAITFAVAAGLAVGVGMYAALMSKQVDALRVEKAQLDASIASSKAMETKIVRCDAGPCVEVDPRVIIPRSKTPAAYTIVSQDGRHYVLMK